MNDVESILFDTDSKNPNDMYAMKYPKAMYTMWHGNPSDKIDDCKCTRMRQINIEHRHKSNE